MELLDRYLQAVKKYLPWQRQDDILAELRANLEAQLEEKEEELGRPLTQKEAEEWLKHIGPPMKMAARYQPQQYLIGPELFPVYWYVLKLVMFWAVAVFLIVSGVQLAVDQTSATSAALHAALKIPGVLVQSAGWVTVIFAALELVAKYYPMHMPQQIREPHGAMVAREPAAAGAGQGAGREAKKLRAGRGRSRGWLGVSGVAGADSEAPVSAAGAGCGFSAYNAL